jgi:hypothetical protein
MTKKTTNLISWCQNSSMSIKMNKGENFRDHLRLFNELNIHLVLKYIIDQTHFLI